MIDNFINHSQYIFDLMVVLSVAVVVPMAVMVPNLISRIVLENFAMIQIVYDVLRRFIFILYFLLILLVV